MLRELLCRRDVMVILIVVSCAAVGVLIALYDAPVVW